MAPEPVADARVHVLIDCTAIPAIRAGVGRYIEGLLGGLSPDQVILSLVVQRRDHKALAKIAPWAGITSISPLLQVRVLRLIWEQTSLPQLARALGVDVVHSPHYTYPRGWRGGRVVTLHDATFFSHPETHEGVKRYFFRSWIRRSWRDSDVVVTPSAASASELTRFLGAPRAKLEVAYLGVDLNRFHPPTHDEVRTFRSGLVPRLGRSWFAFLGTIEPRKNVVALLEGYQQLRNELGESTPELVVSGGRGWDRAALARLDSLGSDSGVRFLGYLPMARLSALLGGAIAVVYPSVGEGFGLPVLEAMASGAAVITTKRLAIPEVGGDAVVYVEPTAADIRDALRDAIQDPSAGEQLKARAVRRASLFTWHATAARHLAAYQAASSSPRRS